MANDCSFVLRAYGSKESLEELADSMNYENDICFYRIFDFSPTISEHDGKYSLIGYGSCAWSVHGCLFDNDKPLPCMVRNYSAMQVNFLDFCTSRNIEFDIWSEEPGCAFIEHYRSMEGEFLEEETSAIWWNEDACAYFEEHGEDCGEEYTIVDNSTDAKDVVAFNRYGCFYNDLEDGEKSFVDNTVDEIDWDLITNYFYYY